VRLLTADFFKLNTCFQRYDKLDVTDYVMLSDTQVMEQTTILFVCHIWQTAEMPDLTGIQFEAVQEYLRREQRPCVVFYDYSSVPQCVGNFETRESVSFEEPRHPRAERREMASLNEARLKDVRQNLFKSLHDLYSGQLHPRTRVINICPTDLYQVRAWPYYEIFISRIYGTLDTSYGRGELPLLSLCDRFLDEPLTMDVLGSLKEQRVYMSRTFAAGLDDLQSSLRLAFMKDCERHSNVLGAWLSFHLGDSSQLERDRIFENAWSPLEAARDIVNTCDFRGCSYHEPLTATLPIVSTLIQELLHVGLTYSILGAGISENADRTRLLTLCHMKREDNYKAYMNLKGIQTSCTSQQDTSSVDM